MSSSNETYETLHIPSFPAQSEIPDTLCVQQPSLHAPPSTPPLPTISSPLPPSQPLPPPLPSSQPLPPSPPHTLSPSSPPLSKRKVDEQHLSGRIERAIDLIDLETSCIVVVNHNTTNDQMIAYSFKNNPDTSSTMFISNESKIGDEVEVFQFKILADPYQIANCASQFEVCDVKSLFKFAIPDVNDVDVFRNKLNCTIFHDNSCSEERDNELRVTNALEKGLNVKTQDMIKFAQTNSIKRNLVLNEIDETHETDETLKLKKQRASKVRLKFMYEKGTIGFRGKYQIMSRFDNTTKSKHILRNGEIGVDLSEDFDDLHQKIHQYSVKVEKEVQRLKLEHEKKEILKAIEIQTAREKTIYEELFDCKERLEKNKDKLLEMDDAISIWEEENDNDESTRYCNIILQEQ